MDSNDFVSKGAWVKIKASILPAGKRKAGLPSDTAAVPFEMMVNGYLVASATTGDKVVLTTATGRSFSGTLQEEPAGYTHTFGAPDPALLEIGVRVKEWLKR